MPPLDPKPSFLPETPHSRWWEDAVFYHILVDRFYPSNGKAPTGDPSLPEFCGGDLLGIVQKLGYLRGLGVTALWLSPINCTTAYHGYHITDYLDIDARFGGKSAFNALLDAANPDIRIIMDWVPNHVHRSHPFFLSARNDPKSRYRDWFHFDCSGRYLCYLDYAELPKLNLDHPEARQYMIACCLTWLDLGVSGFRMDHVLGPSIEFWQVLKTEIKRRHPSAFLFGEATCHGIKRKHLKTLRLPRKYAHYAASRSGKNMTTDVMLEYKDVFDGLLDFEFQHILKTTLARAEKRPSTARIQALLDAHYARFPKALALPSFLDNHDMNRFLFEAGGNKARLVKAAALQFTQSQPPIIYYGTEAGMGQRGPVAGPHGDLNARQMMPWTNRDRDLLAFYADLIIQRKSAAQERGK